MEESRLVNNNSLGWRMMTEIRVLKYINKIVILPKCLFSPRLVAVAMGNICMAAYGNAEMGTQIYIFSFAQDWYILKSLKIILCYLPQKVTTGFPFLGAKRIAITGSLLMSLWKET